MRRTISLLLVLIMLLTPVSALADDGSLRHDVHGDISEFEVSGEQSEGKSGENGTEASIGTDVYLFVDPDTASYVVFYVTDEEGKPIEGALIYLGYAGDTELFGATNEDGLLGAYLFRGAEYSYKVYKPGYELAEGEFTPTESLTRVRVVLRKYHRLEIVVVDRDKPVSGVDLDLEGMNFVTDENGMVTVFRTNGVYNAEVITPDGRRIPVKITVNGDTRVVIDISRDEEGLIPGGLYCDRFLVYDRNYDPEDYVLTKYLFSAEDVAPESAGAYLEQTRDTVLIEAMCDHEQHENAPDTDIPDTDGEPRFSQRSLMPSGFVMRAWEKEGFDSLVFTNEELGLRFAPEALHSGDMMKVFALIHWLSDESVELADIAVDEVSKAWNGYADAGFDKISPWDLDVGKVDLDAVKDFVFESYAEEGDETLPDSLFTDSIFEFRVTPIRPEAMLAMLRGGLTGEHAVPVTEMTIASYGYFAEELRRHLALGLISESESDELFAYFADGRLSDAELQQLREKKADGTLSDAELQLLLDAAADGKLYRVSCYVTSRYINVEITSCIEGLELIRKADRLFDGLIAELEQADPSLASAQLSAMAEEALLRRWDFMLVERDPVRRSMETYRPGELSAFAAPRLERSLDEESEFFEQLMGKYFPQYSVDVRRELSPFDTENTWFRAYITEGGGTLGFHRALVTSLDSSALTALSRKA